MCTPCLSSLVLVSIITLLGACGSDPSEPAVDARSNADSGPHPIDAALPTDAPPAQACSALPAQQCGECCITENPAAFETLATLLFTECGCNTGSPCEAECSANFCQGGGTAPSTECAACIETQATSVATCVQTAFFSCAINPSCLAGIECLTMCPL
jgi:hypothetical protein